MSHYAFESECLGSEFIETHRRRNGNRYVFILCLLSVFYFIFIFIFRSIARFEKENDAILMWKDSEREMSRRTNTGIVKRAPAEAWDGTDVNKVKFTSSNFLLRKLVI